MAFDSGVISTTTCTLKEVLNISLVPVVGTLLGTWYEQVRTNAVTELRLTNVCNDHASLRDDVTRMDSSLITLKSAVADFVSSAERTVVTRKMDEISNKLESISRLDTLLARLEKAVDQFVPRNEIELQNSVFEKSIQRLEIDLKDKK